MIEKIKLFHIGVFEHKTAKTYRIHDTYRDIDFKRAGFETYKFDYRKYNLLNNLNIIKEFNPDIIFICKAEGRFINIKRIKKYCALNKMKPMIFFYFYDVISSYNWIAMRAIHSHVVGLSNSDIDVRNQIKTKIKQINPVNYKTRTPLFEEYHQATGYRHKPNYNISKSKFNICFFGKLHQQPFTYYNTYERRDFIFDLSKKFTIAVVGRNEIRKVPRNIQLFPECHNLRRSKILFNSNIILGYDRNPLIYRSTCNRTWNMLSTGRLNVIRYFNGIETFFENHKHLIWFKSLDECIDVIKHYLKHPESSKKIALNAYNLIKNKHTYLHRAEQLKNIYLEWKMNERANSISN